MAATINPPARERVNRRRAGDPIYARGGSTGVDTDDVLQSVQKGDLSQAIPDPFGEQKLYEIGAGTFRILPPPVNLAALLRMPNDNSILRQCIEAMVINVEGHGWRLEYIGPDGEDQSPEAVKEREDIEMFLPTLHPEHSITELRKRIRWDTETLGFSYIEIGKSKDKLPIFMSHIPGHTMRMTTVDMEEVPVPTDMVQFGRNIKGQVRRRFRRYVQIVGTKKVYFKEHGDPRDIDPKDGLSKANLKYEDTATEIIFIKQYYPGQAYGLPRWFNNLVAIQGSRQAELTNLDYFKENAIPAMAVLVSGGSLANQTIQQIEDHVTAARGRAAQNRVLIIEVEGDENAASKDGTIPVPKVELKPLAGERIKEGQFLEYDKAQTEKVRSSFRLPPIFTGHAQDYSHASAKTSYEVAEGQVFGPERAILDDIINRHILAPYGVKFWELKSNPPRISDPEEVIKALTAFNEVGAMTPNVAIGLANEQFGLDIAPIEEDWGNYPWALVQDLALAGKLIGFEDIMKEIEEKTETGEEVDEATAAADDQTAIGDGADEAQKARQIRRAISGLAEVLEVNAKAAYQPRKRRIVAKARPPASGKPWIDPSSPPPAPELAVVRATS